MYRILKSHDAEKENLSSVENIYKDYSELYVNTDKEEIHDEESESDKDDGSEVDDEDKEDQLQKVTAHYDSIIESAHREAEEILEAANVTAMKMRKEAFDEGYQNGREEALEQVRVEMQDEMKSFGIKIQEAFDEISEKKQAIIEEYIDDLKNIVIAVSDKVIRTSVRSSSDVIKKMIISATEKHKNISWAKIYISSDFANAEMDLKGDANFMRSLSTLSDSVKIVVMKESDSGTCIIEMPNEVLDISVGSQMENIKDIINNAGI